ncbi:MAG: hypothetical protein AAGA97_01430 [Pseudomonadota bacterium]
MINPVAYLDASQATRRFHAYRAGLRARRLNNRPPGAGFDQTKPQFQGEET